MFFPLGVAKLVSRRVQSKAPVSGSTELAEVPVKPFCYSASGPISWHIKAPSFQQGQGGFIFWMFSIIAGAAETDDPQAAIRMGNVPAGATGVVPRVVPGAAAHHFIFVTEERGSVSAARIGLIPVSDPLPGIPCHIVGTIGAGSTWIASYGHRVADAIVRV